VLRKFHGSSDAERLHATNCNYPAVIIYLRFIYTLQCSGDSARWPNAQN